MVHVSETCEPTAPHLLTHVHTTTAAVHEARCTAPIQQALAEKELLPSEHLVDAAYIDAELLVSSQQDYGITLRGPARPNPNWQANVEGAYTLADFAVDWERQQVHCPQGKAAASWAARVDATGRSYIQVRFRQQDCRACGMRVLCTRAAQAPRSLTLHPQAEFKALQAARAWYRSAEGQQRYKQRAGIEGTLSQGVRGFGLRYTRYRGLAKTHLQHVATAAAINVDRLIAWFDRSPPAKNPDLPLCGLGACITHSPTVSEGLRHTAPAVGRRSAPGGRRVPQGVPLSTCQSPPREQGFWHKEERTMQVGYARVSTPDQSLAVQLEALQQHGCTKIFQEVASGDAGGAPGPHRRAGVCATWGHPRGVAPRSTWPLAGPTHHADEYVTPAADRIPECGGGD